VKELCIHLMDQSDDVTLVYFEMQAQLVSAVRMAISTASGPLLLEAGLELATRVCIAIRSLFCTP
jgi:hypothetical protein